MTRYSIEPNVGTFVKGCGFFYLFLKIWAKALVKT